MEYFDFEGASSAHDSNHPSDDVASLDLEFDEPEERDARFDSLLQDQSLDFPANALVPESAEQYVGDSIGPDQDTGVYPMFRAQEPCDFCRRMGLDCFVAKRGVMQNGCTCCISLYRECSFTHAKVPGKFLQTLHTVSENAYIPTGGLTGKRALKSVSYGAFGDDTDARSRKNSARFSRRAVTILKGWLRDHNENPYPNEVEKDELKQNTGLTRIQISNWLANARRRGKVRPSTGTNSPVPGAVDIPGSHPKDPALMTPLERWKYSPPENEPATISDITRALANPPFDPSRQRRTHSGHVRPRHPGSSTNESSHASSEHKRYTASASSLDTSRSSISDLSFASAFSHRSSLSFGSMDRKERHRRRRKPSIPANTFHNQKAKAVRPFQCTFCTDSFAAKYDWQRHEKSMHLILDKWTCSPHGGVTEENGILRCVFCSAANPDRDHLETHNYMSCQEKSLQERTFYRKDHLNQHLRLMHNAKFQPCMDKWQSSIAEIKSRCGFCATVMHTWKDRVDHLAGHFKNGASMAQWQGDWGFEPSIQERVENAVPPYLIDYEWRSPDPWTTVQAQGDGTSPQLEVPNDANCYMRLTRELTSYVHNQKAQGVVPTDQMLQTEARRVIYGNDDDPWNQTCADNPLWLTILKRDTGLESPANNEDIQLSDLGLQPPFTGRGVLQQPPQDAANIFARGVGAGALPSPAVSSPGLRSPAYPPTGFSSTAPSGQGSLAGSYAGSSGMISAGVPAFISDWSSSLPGHASSSSIHADREAPDPLVQMGFDPEFLQRLSDSYSELTPPDMETVPLDASIDYEGKGKQPWLNSVSQTRPLLGLPASDPLAALHSKEGYPPASDAAQSGQPAFRDDSGTF
ncbi:uncharacterized protein N7473_010300 [Penicillium subrubescens]|jgi:hypothetical protein|uniref:Homeobox protein 4 n=1 Tax=Penicillium subrubescens TaxID=1316194 RepID=A0A1Q5UBU3_9EURO|nr:uncharacterized protein N7473_010300 [Penicillium subrubescens]KAJ5883414.1 hypothetical protein N7473_010300 [Penicillium subrubescens]OKP09933.1 hypothetical protein PENSUB_4645 [Penicillium subrubescens]